MLTLPDRVAAFDTETTGLWPWPLRSRSARGLAPDRPFMFQVANLDGEAVSFRGTVDPLTRAVRYRNCKSELRWLQSLIEDPTMRIVCHNAPFEYRHTTQEDLAFRWRCKIEDTRIMARVANPTSEWQGYGLKPLAKKYLKIPDEDQKALHRQVQRARRLAQKRGWTIATKETHGQKPMYADYWLPEVEDEVEVYGRLDPIRTIGLWRMYVEWFDENRDGGGGLWGIYEWERRALRTVIRMERAGMTYLSETGTSLRTHYRDYMAVQKKAVTEQAQALGFTDLNLQSSKQMKAVFIDTLHRTTEHTTKNKAPKIDAEQLMAWARGSAAGADVDGDGPDGCTLSRAVLEWKAGKKVIEYIDSYDFFSCEDRDDGSLCVHPAWDQAGARTGRFSCHDPNTMQIASAETSRRHSHIRARQREAWGPRPEHLWYMPDYSQIEVWIFAFAANEQAMMDALLSGEDFHFATARAAWGMRDDFCTCGADPNGVRGLPREAHVKGCLVKWWRQRAKMILFSRLYGGGIKKVQQLIRCTLEEAEEFVFHFNENLPGVQNYMRRLVDEVRESGLLINLFGREYQIERDKAYKAVNYMVQGSAAEVMKRAIVRVDQYLRQNYDRAYVVGSVHDELLAELHESHHSASLMRTIIRLMQKDSDRVPNLTVPLPVGMKYTRTHWSEAKEVLFMHAA